MKIQMLTISMPSATLLLLALAAPASAQVDEQSLSVLVGRIADLQEKLVSESAMIDELDDSALTEDDASREAAQKLQELISDIEKQLGDARIDGDADLSEALEVELFEYEGALLVEQSRSLQARKAGLDSLLSVLDRISRNLAAQLEQLKSVGNADIDLGGGEARLTARSGGATSILLLDDWGISSSGSAVRRQMKNLLRRGTAPDGRDGLESLYGLKRWLDQFALVVDARGLVAQADREHLEGEGLVLRSDALDLMMTIATREFDRFERRVKPLIARGPSNWRSRADRNREPEEDDLDLEACARGDMDLCS